MARYLLDTDAIIDFLKGAQPAISIIQGLDADGDVLCVCDIVLAEVYSGLNEHQASMSEPLLDTFEFLAPTPKISMQAGQWRYSYARQGIALPVTDTLIAATAYHHGATIITRNVRHFPMPEITVMPLPLPTTGREK